MKEALRLALEALGWTDEWRPQGLREEAIIKCKEALAQDELCSSQEPVAWMDIENGTFSGLRYWSEPDNRHEVALYTTPTKGAA